MRVKVTESFKYEGEEYEKGETPDLPESVAKSVINKEYAEKLIKDEEKLGEPPEISIPEQNNQNNASGNGRIEKIPVKTGGKSWIDVTLFKGNPEAEEDWKKKSGIKIQKKTIEDNEVKELDDGYNLSPSRAIAIAPILQHFGIMGKTHDRKQKEGSN